MQTKNELNSFSNDFLLIENNYYQRALLTGVFGFFILVSIVKMFGGYIAFFCLRKLSDL